MKRKKCHIRKKKAYIKNIIIPYKPLYGKKNPYMEFFFPYPRWGIRAYMGPNISLIFGPI